MQPKGPNQPKPKFAKSWGLPPKPTPAAKPEHVQKLAKALKR
jgi:hypothetical protein